MAVAPATATDGNSESSLFALISGAGVKSMTFANSSVRVGEAWFENVWMIGAVFTGASAAAAIDGSAAEPKGRSVGGESDADSEFPSGAIRRRLGDTGCAAILSGSM